MKYTFAMTANVFMAIISFAQHLARMGDPDGFTDYIENCPTLDEEMVAQHPQPPEDMNSEISITLTDNPFNFVERTVTRYIDNAKEFLASDDVSKVTEGQLKEVQDHLVLFEKAKEILSSSIAVPA